MSAKENTISWEKLSYPRLTGLLAQQPTRYGQAMHNAAFAACSLPFHYIAFDTLDTAFALEAMRKLGIRGLSLTIPHKEQAVALVDSLSAEASVISAVNTVLFDGRHLRGENTDWWGIAEAYREAGVGLREKRAFVFGAGGAARAFIYALRHEGVKEIAIGNRSPQRARSPARELQLEAVETSEAMTRAIETSDLLINASPIGSALAGSAEFPFPLSAIEAQHCVFDAVVAETKLISVARKAGASTISGGRMLLHQALKQFELFTGGLEAPVSTMEEALRREMSLSASVAPS